MTQQNEITNLVREADDQKTPETLFQYTSLGVLALILKTGQYALIHSLIWMTQKNRK